MSDFILLLDSGECPACRRPFVPSHLPGRCRNCGMMLFTHGNNLSQYEADTGWREYWVWTGEIDGWKHRTQIFNPQPLERNYSAPELAPDYGTPEYNRRQLETSPERQELKKEYKRLRKKPVTVRC